MIAAGNSLGFLAVRNHQATSVGEAGSTLVAENLDRYSTGMVACWSCPVHCRHRFKIEDGPYQGTSGEGPEYASVGSMGWKIGNLNMESILNAGIHTPMVCRQCKKMKCLNHEETDEALEKTKFIWPRQRAETCPFGGLNVFEDLAFHCDLCRGDPQCISVCTNGAVVIKT